MRFGSALSDQEAATRAHVAALGQARLSNKALSATEGQLWWSESRLTARLSQAGGDWALSVVNVGESERTISNSLAWAGMPAGAWRDVLTGAVFNTVADALTVDVPALGSRVLVWESP
jgi:hypothetical protein